MGSPRQEVTEEGFDSGQWVPANSPVCPTLPSASSLRDPINLQVLQAFVDCHEFANLNLVQALR